PNVLGLVSVDTGLEVIEAAGIEAIRSKSIALTEWASELCESSICRKGWRIVSPPDPDSRGSHITVSGPHAKAVVGTMAALGAIADFRLPDLIRLGLSPLTTTFAEVWDGIRILAEAIEALS
ncbi:MAG: kynureninase, partial [Acidimicrobiales bacterium]